VEFKDIYLTVKELPFLGNVRFGHFKTPFGLENLTSHRFATFMERAMISEGELEGRRAGIMAFNHSESERSTWAIAAVITQIQENPPVFKNDSWGAAVVTRYSFLPWYDEATEGRGLLHTAVSYAYGDIAAGNPVRFVERPEAHLATPVIDTGSLDDVAAINAMGAELALVYGPLSVQSEFVSYWADRTENPSSFFYGAYAYASYFLTGENRRYKRTSGTFDSVKPYENFFRVRTRDGSTHMGIGAWELAYRYSFLDLNSRSTNGGWARNHTFGVNWYLNAYTRLMFNYVRSEVRDHPDAPGTGLADVFEMRAQVDF
jgi:phosphate-selective porin OprO/OprP